MVASSFLAYGGNLNVVRSDDTDLANAFSGTAGSIKINSTDDYVNKQYDENVITRRNCCCKKIQVLGVTILELRLLTVK